MNRENLRKGIELDGKYYEVMPLGGFDSLTALFRFKQILLPAVGTVIDNIKETDNMLPEHNDLFSKGILYLLDGLHRADVIGLIKKLTEDVKVDGEKVDIDVEFTGDLANFLLLAEFAIRLNFEKAFIDWLDKKGFTIPSLVEKVKEMSGHLLDKSNEESKEKQV